MNIELARLPCIVELRLAKGVDGQVYFPYMRNKDRH